MFNLVRNIGSSIGISVMQALLIRNTQTMHASLAAHLSPYAHTPMPALPGGSAAGALAALNAMVTRQAAMIAYIDDFKLMLVLTLASIPLLFLMSSGRQAPGASIAME